MKKIGYFFIVIIVVLFIIILAPICTADENWTKVSGTVKSISEGGVEDLVFELENEEIVYYINRGLENGFDLEKSKRDFTGKKVTLYYTKSWTPLAPFGKGSESVHHLLINDSIVFSEW
ncbi:hypothetical protein [Flavobacterium terrisoli]|uniref:hypothetical protein n=1 Tax=Flavobacterium terrisoli TaxID=3242195 RepID=UPI0025427337|nr:hypothetical protein [Flavobacterium buctense]